MSVVLLTAAIKIRDKFNQKIDDLTEIAEAEQEIKEFLGEDRVKAELYIAGCYYVCAKTLETVNDGMVLGALNQIIEDTPLREEAMARGISAEDVMSFVNSRAPKVKERLQIKGIIGQGMYIPDLGIEPT